MRTLTHFVLDALACLALVAVARTALTAMFPEVGPATVTAWWWGMLCAVAAGVIGAYVMGLHEDAVTIRPKTVAVRSTTVAVVAALATVLAPYFVVYSNPGRVAPLLAGVAIWTSLVSWRLLRAWFLLQRERVPVVIVGTADEAAAVARSLAAATHSAYAVVGRLDPQVEHAVGDEDSNFAFVAGIGDLDAARERLGVHTVLVTPNVGGDSASGLWDALRRAGMESRLADSVVMEESSTLPPEFVDAGWLFRMQDRNRGGLSALGKRTLDVLVGSVGLLCFAVAAPFLYVVVSLSSPGPFLYSQERVGRGGVPFRMFKVRSMRQSTESGQRWASEDVERITRVGRILRQLRLDELPQFWNVLRGDMSVVGPRPEQPELAKSIAQRLPAFHFRTIVKPGITGWAQINAGYAASVSESRVKLAHDLFYITKAGALFDIGVMLRTVFVILARFGAR